jgi:GWxTD domain-containing protein
VRVLCRFGIGVLVGLLLVGAGTGPLRAAASLMRQLEEECIDLLRRARPSVVNVIVEREAAPEVQGFSRDEPPLAPGMEFERQIGCGIVLDDKGHVLTTLSVVSDALQIMVEDHEGRQAAAVLLGADPLSNLAVIQADLEDPAPIAVGDSDRVLPGSWVVNVGSTYGGVHSVSFGMIAGKGPNAGLGPFPDYLQFNAVVNPGDSGGAVVDARGQLVGVTVAVLDDAGDRGGEMGFAIPANRALEIARELIANGQIVRAWLGATVSDYRRPRGDLLGGPERGVAVVRVVDGSPAATAGLREGDVILRVDGEPITDTAALKMAIHRRHGGETARFLIWRDGLESRLDVRLTEDPTYDRLPLRAELTDEERREMDLMSAAELAFGKRVYIDYERADHARRKRLAHFFWSHYPPGSRQVIEERLAYVERNFGSPDTPGRLTDKGRVYLQFGSPDRITTSRFERGESELLRDPNEIDTWYYYSQKVAFQFNVEDNFLYDNPLRSMIRLDEQN